MDEANDYADPTPPPWPQWMRVLAGACLIAGGSIAFFAVYGWIMSPARGHH